MQSRRMTEEEYQKRMAGLLDEIQKDSAEIVDDAEVFEKYRQAEFDLMIEYRLGADFSKEKWEQLRTIHDQMQQKMEVVRGQHAEGKLSQQQLLSQIQALSSQLQASYKKVLTEKEFVQLLGKGEQDVPFLDEADML